MKFGENFVATLLPANPYFFVMKSATIFKEFFFALSLKKTHNYKI